MKEFIKSIFAGIMIGIAGTVYLNTPEKYIGAILFAVGLIVICYFNYNLFTGKIGYIKSYKNIPFLLQCLYGNFIGVFLVALCNNTDTSAIMLTKIDTPLYITLLKSIFCGFLMYVSVDTFKQKQNIIGICYCIPTFVLAGFEHSIADLFYICCSNVLTFKMIPFIIIVILGNSIGALLHKCLNMAEE